MAIITKLKNNVGCLKTEIRQYHKLFSEEELLLIHNVITSLRSRIETKLDKLMEQHSKEGDVYEIRPNGDSTRSA